MIPLPNLSDLVRDCQAFAPELIVCFGILLMLLLRLFSAFDRTHMAYVALGTTVTALLVSLLQWPTFAAWAAPLFLGEGATAFDWAHTPETFIKGNSGSAEMFTGLLVFDDFTVYLRMFLYAFVLLVIWLTMLTGIPDRDDSADFYTLLLGSTLGMAMMAATNHLLMLFIAIEMTSLPSYALAGFLKGRRQSSEAALKYVVYGGGAAGVMLYGISLLAGRFGTAHMPTLAQRVVEASAQPGVDAVLILGVVFIMIGIAFKLSAVPFHFWCPDVFEGASAEVAGFLSVASKGAALALLARIAFVLIGLHPGTQANFTRLDNLPWDRLSYYLVPAIAVVAIATATFGNLAAYLQTNLKRLLAYSTIAHAGYMLMGLATLNQAGAKAVLFYLVAYLLMNLGAFAVIAFLRNQTGSEDLDSYRGLVRRSPFMVVTLSVFLLSLLGVPPLAGFAAKFQIFAALFQSAEKAPGALSTVLYVTLVLGLLNSVLSAFYYIKVLKVMILETRLEDVEGTEPTPLREPVGAMIYSGLLAASLFVLGILWGPLDRASAHGVERFKPELHPKAVVVAPAPTGGGPGGMGGGGRRPGGGGGMRPGGGPQRPRGGQE